VRNIFKRLFGKSKEDKITTAPLSPHKIQPVIYDQKPFFELQQLIAGCGQSLGKQREINEDSLLAITTTLAGNSGSMPFGLYIVADGMGGHQYGEVASNLAVRSIADNILRKMLPSMFSFPYEPINESLQEIMFSGITDAQRIVKSKAPGSGTTLTAALILGRQVTIAHVGDSRAYVISHKGNIEAVTRDHSLVRRLEELGQITSAEASIHPQRNVLYRALGQGDNLEPDIFTISFPQPGYLMLCSDGLWGVVVEQDIYKSIVEASNLQRACQNLVTAANAAGGPDNISVILVQLVG
jgi:serine/threonine protein phosphatase PrpC